MKNKILAVILAGMAFSLCAGENPRNADLLPHLLGVEAEIISVLQKHRDFEVPEEGKIAVDFYLELIDGLGSIQPFQQLIIDQLARPEFNLICEEGLSFEEAVHRTSPGSMGSVALRRLGNEYIDYLESTEPLIKISDELKKELFKLYSPVVASVWAKYSSKDKNGILAQSKIKESISEDEFEDMLSTFSPELLSIENYPLLKLIDAKIAELEDQV